MKEITNNKKQQTYQFVLNKLVALYNNLLTHNVAVAQDAYKQEVSRDLDALSNVNVLSKNKDWQTTAKEIVSTQKYNGHKVSGETIKKIEDALAKLKVA
jgi:hypothetical protein